MIFFSFFRQAFCWLHRDSWRRLNGKTGQESLGFYPWSADTQVKKAGAKSEHPVPTLPTTWVQTKFLGHFNRTGMFTRRVNK